MWNKVSASCTECKPMKGKQFVGLGKQTGSDLIIVMFSQLCECSCKKTSGSRNAKFKCKSPKTSKALTTQPRVMFKLKQTTTTIYNILICITLNNKIPVNITKSAPVSSEDTKWSWFDKKSEKLTQADI